jgi:hypothetical protein
MRLSFSLTYVLLAIGFIALGCAAFTQESELCAELLWVLTVFAACYALLAVCYLRGMRQAAALGFLVLWLAYLACVIYVPHRTPARRVLTLAGYGEASPPDKMEDYRMLINGLNADYRRNEPANKATYDALYLKYEMALGNRPEIRAANAIGSMVAGIIGSVLGTFVYSRSRKLRDSKP